MFRVIVDKRTAEAYLFGFALALLSNGRDDPETREIVDIRVLNSGRGNLNGLLLVVSPVEVVKNPIRVLEI